MMDKVGFLVVLFLAVYGVKATSYTECESSTPYGTVQRVDVTGCEEEAPKCELHRNTNVTFKLTFTTPHEVSKVKAIVHGVIMHAPVPFALPNGDGCVDSGIVCPLTEGQTYVYETSLPVHKKYPKVTVDVKWELQDESNNDIVCVIIPAKLV